MSEAMMTRAQWEKESQANKPTDPAVPIDPRVVALRSFTVHLVDGEDVTVETVGDDQHARSVQGKYQRFYQAILASIEEHPPRLATAKTDEKPLTKRQQAAQDKRDAQEGEES